MSEDPRRVDIRPFELFGQATALVGKDYWLFLGITAVGVLLGSLVPFGLILGPLMCGIYLSFRARSRGETVEFGLLWKGFELFVESLIATLIMFGVMLVLMAPVLVLYGLGIAAFVYSEEEGILFGSMGIFYALVFVISIAVGALFLFVYPLIADRRVSGATAVSMSVKAVLANPWGVLKLVLFTSVLGLLGVLCCFVGGFFLMPLTMGMTWLAYRQVFPAAATGVAPAEPDAF